MVELVFRLPTSVTNGFGIAIMIMLGRYGNSIYRKHVERKILQIKTKIAPDYWSLAFRDSGGTSSWAPIPLILLHLLTLYGMYQGILQKNIGTNVIASDTHTSMVISTLASAYDKCKKLAENGNAEAQDKLGRCYEFGEGVAKDDVEAVKWYRKSADQNYAQAQWWLGYCYESGAMRSVLPEDATEAVKWYRKAADQGNRSSQYSLGYCYKTGEGVAENDAEAVKWFLRAANQGDYTSQSILGYDYEYGKGVAKNPVEAYKWYNLASVFWGTNETANRDTLAASMAPDQIAKAQKLSTEFKPQKEPASTNSN